MAGRSSARALLGVLALALGWYALAARGVWFPVVPLALGFLLSAAVAAGLRAIREARERAALMSLFARHVSPEVARERRDAAGLVGDPRGVGSVRALGSQERHGDHEEDARERAGERGRGRPA